MITLIQHTFIICFNYEAQPNQSLKLTEVAVDDSPRGVGRTLEHRSGTSAQTNYFAAAVRRRSLAPVR